MLLEDMVKDQISKHPSMADRTMNLYTDIVEHVYTAARHQEYSKTYEKFREFIESWKFR